MAGLELLIVLLAMGGVAFFAYRQVRKDKADAEPSGEPPRGGNQEEK